MNLFTITKREFLDLMIRRTGLTLVDVEAMGTRNLSKKSMYDLGIKPTLDWLEKFKEQLRGTMLVGTEVLEIMTWADQGKMDRVMAYTERLNTSRLGHPKNCIVIQGTTADEIKLTLIAHIVFAEAVHQLCPPKVITASTKG